MSPTAPDDSTLVEHRSSTCGHNRHNSSRLTLVLTWSDEEPERVGEVVILPRGSWSLGRAVNTSTSATPVVLNQLRPTTVIETGPFRAPRVSRYQLFFDIDSRGARVRCGHRGEMWVNANQVESASISPGDRIRVAGRFSLLACERPAFQKMPANFPEFRFGEADSLGIVGESPAAWSLRRDICDIARRSEHVLLHGPSGSGKELTARALHQLSSRSSEQMVVRSAITIPELTADAELFGNFRDHPSQGTPARPGLMGQANHSNLFLDEVGELPPSIQARLLRVLEDGEYQQLGDSARRHTNARVFAATNLPITNLRPDFCARFPLRIELPSLTRRREDIPLIARHLMRQFADDNPDIRQQFFAADEPRLSEELIDFLVSLPYRTHVREVATVLWESIRRSTGKKLEVPSLFAVYASGHEEPAPKQVAKDRLTGLSREQVMTILQRTGWVREKAWRELGLRNRYQLRRLLSRLNIQPPAKNS